MGWPGKDAYTASKGAIAALTRSTMDVANAALFLASDESARTTGHILTVDSGLTIS